MTVDARVFTADELLEMPEDGNRYELVEGELQKMSPAGTDHGDIAMTIGAHLKSFVRQRQLGKVYSADTGFLLAQQPDTVRAPDVAFVRTERVVKTPKYVPGAPDLAIEVLSPGDSFREVEIKIREYLRHGTQAVVIVEPETRLVRVYRAGQSPEDVVDGLTVDDVVPGWKMPLSEIFEE
jgi:Uma2 family endonuclease